MQQLMKIFFFSRPIILTDRCQNWKRLQPLTYFDAECFVKGRRENPVPHKREQGRHGKTFGKALISSLLSATSNVSSFSLFIDRPSRYSERFENLYSRLFIILSFSSVALHHRYRLVRSSGYKQVDDA